MIMQKSVVYESTWNLEKYINSEINNGWSIKYMQNYKDELIIIYEKIGRKEKLEHLNNLSDDK